MSQPMLQKKICMLGGFSVGKTSLVPTFANTIAPEIEQRIRDALRALAARLGISTNTVLKVSRGPFDASATPREAVTAAINASLTVLLQ